MRDFNKEYKQSYEMKLQHTKELIQDWCLYTFDKDTKFVLAFSGGKDSTILYYLIKQTMGKDWIDKHLIVETAPELFYPEIKQYINEFYKRENITIEYIQPKLTFSQVSKLGVFGVSKDFMWSWYSIYNADKNNTNRNQKRLDFVNKCLSKYNLTYNDIKHFTPYPYCCSKIKLSKSKHKEPYFVGLRAIESPLRKLGWEKTGCINLKQKTLKPISLWSDLDEMRFIKENNIQIAKCYDYVKRSGCVCCPYSLSSKSGWKRFWERHSKFKVLISKEQMEFYRLLGRVESLFD